MDIFALKKQYRGRLAFHGGMSIQRVLPFGTPAEVRHATRQLIEAGRQGGYIFAPSHTVPPDVPPANLVAMMEELRSQPGAPIAARQAWDSLVAHSAFPAHHGIRT
jgi:uroporphyrinogen decarboxylase